MIDISPIVASSKYSIFAPYIYTINNYEEFKFKKNTSFHGRRSIIAIWLSRFCFVSNFCGTKFYFFKKIPFINTNEILWIAAPVFSCYSGKFELMSLIKKKLQWEWLTFFFLRGERNKKRESRPTVPVLKSKCGIGLKLGGGGTDLTDEQLLSSTFPFLPLCFSLIISASLKRNENRLEESKGSLDLFWHQPRGDFPDMKWWGLWRTLSVIEWTVSSFWRPSG